MIICNQQLIDAVRQGNLHKTKELTDNGTDLNTTDNHGMTLLHLAIENGHSDIVKHVWSQSMMAWIKYKQFRKIYPLCTYKFIRSQTLESFKSFRIVIGHNEAVKVLFKLLM